MPGVHIVTDSACDLTDQLVKEHNIIVVPLTIRFGTEEFEDRRQLSPDEIATLVTAGKVTLGWREDRSETDPELISKAILNFRSNPTNAWISGDGAKSYALERCDLVSNGPFLLGIKI